MGVTPIEKSVLEFIVEESPLGSNPMCYSSNVFKGLFPLEQVEIKEGAVVLRWR